MKPKITFHRKKMEISTDNGEVARHYGDLMYVTFKDPFCRLQFVDGVHYKVDISLKYLQENIPKMIFFRCSRTTIINICYYKEYQIDSATVRMDDGMVFKLSVRSIADFKKQKANIPRISPPCPPCPECTNVDCPDFGLFCLPPER